MIFGSKNIFLFWNKAENEIPLIHKMNIDNIKKRVKNSDWKVIVTTLGKNDEFYLKKLIKLPKYFFKLHNKLQDINSIGGNQSDIA